MTQSNEYRLAHATEEILSFVKDIYARVKELDERITALEMNASDKETK